MDMDMDMDMLLPHIRPDRLSTILRGPADQCVILLRKLGTVNLDLHVDIITQKTAPNPQMVPKAPVNDVLNTRLRVRL